MHDTYGGLWRVHRLPLNRRGGLELWFRRRILRQHLVVFGGPIIPAQMNALVGNPLR